MNLYSKQVELTLLMDQDLDNQRWTLVKCGQRSGKVMITWGLIKIRNYQKVCWLSAHRPEKEMHRVTDHMSRMFDVSGVDVVYSRDYRGTQKTLTVIDEAMWMPDSYSILEEAILNGHDVVAIGSRGPEYDKDLRWTKLKGHSYHTWQLNLLVTREFLQSLYLENPLQAARDYEAY